jgi:hypothetical protein
VLTWIILHVNAGSRWCKWWYSAILNQKVGRNYIGPLSRKSLFRHAAEWECYFSNHAHAHGVWVWLTCDRVTGCFPVWSWTSLGPRGSVLNSRLYNQCCFLAIDHDFGGQRHLLALILGVVGAEHGWNRAMKPIVGSKVCENLNNETQECCPENVICYAYFQVWKNWSSGVSYRNKEWT